MTSKSCLVRLGMLRVLGMLCVPAFCAMSSATPAGAQTADVGSLHNTCLRDATTSKNIIQTTTHRVFTCWGAVAQNYFDYLESSNAPLSEDKQPTGTYVFRAMPKEAGRCWHKTNTADGVSDFGCSINVAKTGN